MEGAGQLRVDLRGVYSQIDPRVSKKACNTSGMETSHSVLLHLPGKGTTTRFGAPQPPGRKAKNQHIYIYTTIIWENTYGGKSGRKHTVGTIMSADLIMPLPCFRVLECILAGMQPFFLAVRSFKTHGSRTTTWPSCGTLGHGSKLNQDMHRGEAGSLCFHLPGDPILELYPVFDHSHFALNKS